MKRATGIELALVWASLAIFAGLVWIAVLALIK